MRSCSVAGIWWAGRTFAGAVPPPFSRSAADSCTIFVNSSTNNGTPPVRS